MFLLDVKNSHLQVDLGVGSKFNLCIQQDLHQSTGQAHIYIVRVIHQDARTTGDSNSSRSYPVRSREKRSCVEGPILIRELFYCTIIAQEKQTFVIYAALPLHQLADSISVSISKRLCCYW